MRSTSPYITNPKRLADVVAALQVLGTYKFYKLSPAGWSERISGDQSKSDYWKLIFSEHPEFFRFDENREKVSLALRRQSYKRFHVDFERVLSPDEISQLPPSDSDRITRAPLNQIELKMLIDTAIGLHARALEQRRDNRWWIPMSSAIGALIGSIIGVALRTLS